MFVTNVRAPLTRFETDTPNSVAFPVLVTYPPKVMLPFWPTPFVQNFTQAMPGRSISMASLLQAER
jgi:hypothetical protein